MARGSPVSALSTMKAKPLAWQAAFIYCFEIACLPQALHTTAHSGSPSLKYPSTFGLIEMFHLNCTSGGLHPMPTK